MKEITLKPLWLDHIERASDSVRPRLYDALFGYLRHGKPIPERLMAYLGIIIDLMRAEGLELPELVIIPTPKRPKKSTEAATAPVALIEAAPAPEPEPVVAEPVAPPLRDAPEVEKVLLRDFAKECECGQCRVNKLNHLDFIVLVNEIFAGWQFPGDENGQAYTHNDENDFYKHMCDAITHECTYAKKFPILTRRRSIPRTEWLVPA